MTQYQAERLEAQPIKRKREEELKTSIRLRKSQLEHWIEIFIKLLSTEGTLFAIAFSLPGQIQFLVLAVKGL